MLSWSINLPQNRPRRIHYIFLDHARFDTTLSHSYSQLLRTRYPCASREGNFDPDTKMNASPAVFLLALVGCAIALPVRPESKPGLLVGIPIAIQEPTEFDGGPQEDSSPMAYALLLSKLSSSEMTSGTNQVQKRNAQEDEQDDLETAAGTYALRPLFVYRQQLAYRQRVRDARRRENRF